MSDVIEIPYEDILLTQTEAATITGRTDAELRDILASLHDDNGNELSSDQAIPYRMVFALDTMSRLLSNIDDGREPPSDEVIANLIEHLCDVDIDGMIDARFGYVAIYRDSSCWVTEDTVLLMACKLDRLAVALAIVNVKKLWRRFVRRLEECRGIEFVR